MKTAAFIVLALVIGVVAIWAWVHGGKEQNATQAVITTRNEHDETTWEEAQKVSSLRAIVLPVVIIIEMLVLMYVAFGLGAFG